MSILSEIKTRLADPAMPGIQKALQVKETGKAVGPTATPKKSAIGESTARAKAEGQIGQLQQQATKQQQQQAAATQNMSAQIQEGAKQLESQRMTQEAQMSTQAAMASAARGAQLDEAMARLDNNEVMKINQVSNMFDQQMKALKSQRGIEEDNIFQQFEQSNEELEFRKDASELEQVAFTMRMRDQQYVDQLTRIGKMRRLENDAAFKKEAMQSALDFNMSQTAQQLGFLEGLYGDERKFNEILSSIDLETALKLAQAGVADQQRGMIASGVMSAGQAGVGYWAGQKDDSTLTEEEQWNWEQK